MGICESEGNDNNKNKYKKISNRGKQFYSAPVKEYLYNNNNNNSSNLGNTINTASQIDLMSLNEFTKKKPSPLYQYNGTYYKKDDQTSLMTFSLHEMQGNSLTKNKAINSRANPKIVNNSIYTCIDETLNESSDEAVEIISDGKMNENMLQKSTDQTTIDSFNEFIGKKDKKIAKKNNIDIYFKKKGVENNNNTLNKNEENKDVESVISGIPVMSVNNLKFGKK